MYNINERNTWTKNYAESRDFFFVKSYIVIYYIPQFDQCICLTFDNAVSVHQNISRLYLFECVFFERAFLTQIYLDTG